MAQLGGQPVPKKDAAPLSDGLDSQTPLSLLETSGGIDLVAEEVSRIAYGDFA